MTLSIYAHFYLKGYLLEKIFASCFTTSIIIIINSTIAIMVDFIFHITPRDLIVNKVFIRIPAVILSKVIFFIMAKSIIRTKQKIYKYKLSNKEWTLLLFSPIISIFLYSQIIHIILETTIITQEKLYNFLFFSLCIILINILNYYLLVRIIKNRKANEELEILKNELYYQKKNINSIKKTYGDLQLLRHDMKNNIFCISALLEQKEYEKAYDYMNQVKNRIDSADIFSKTNNKTVNCIINLKINTAKNLKIKFTYNIDKNLKISNDIDACILISNILDNAIEACKKISDKKRNIHLEIKNNDFFIIIVKNSINSSVLELNPNLKTDKKNQKTHGFGTLSVKNIVKKYDGYLNYYEKDNNFFCKIILPEI